MSCLLIESLDFSRCVVEPKKRKEKERTVVFVSVFIIYNFFSISFMLSSVLPEVLTVRAQQGTADLL